MTSPRATSRSVRQFNPPSLSYRDGPVAAYVRDGEVKTATVGGALEPSAAELARREKLRREG